MASEAYTTLLNQLNRDVAQAGPDDVLQYCADWFAQKLRDEVSVDWIGLDWIGRDGLERGVEL
jgi:hypothetical protein